MRSLYVYSKVKYKSTIENKGKTDTDIVDLTITDGYYKMEKFLYSQLADKFEEMISSGILEVGNKLPSIRALSKERGVSHSTSYQCYIELEKRGLIEARPKSGYYVRFRPSLLKPCTNTFIENDSETADIDDMIREVLQNSSRNDCVHFSVSVPDNQLLPLVKLKKSAQFVLNHHPAQALSYEKPEGNENLRKQIARQAFNSGIQTTPGEIIITSGCLEAINLALRATTCPGDYVAIESPTYYGIHRTIVSMGLIPVEIETRSDIGIDLNILTQLLKANSISACVFVTNFSNPLGASISDNNKKELIRIMEEYSAQLIEVDIYGDIYFENHRPKTCKGFDVADNVILCSSVSKSLAPGYRVGWIMPGKSYGKVLHLKLNQSVASPTLTQAIVGHFIENGRYDLHMRKLRTILHQHSMRYLKAIHEYFPEDIRVTQPKGGYVFWVALRNGINTYSIYQEALTKGVTFAPGQIFSRKFDFSNCLRLSFGTPFSDKVDKALKTLGEIISAHYKALPKIPRNT